MSATQDLIERVLGRTGVVGISLLIACAAFWFGGIERSRTEVTALRAELAAHAARPAQAAAGRYRPEERLASFYGYFSSQKEAFAAIQAVFAAAEAEGLHVDTGEYRLAPERASRLLRYQIVFPVNGSYPKIRRFVARALNDVPGMALDDLTLKRENAQSNKLEARVQLTLYLARG